MFFDAESKVSWFRKWSGHHKAILLGSFTIRLLWRIYTYLDPLRGWQLKKLGWQSAISWGLNFRSQHFGSAAGIVVIIHLSQTLEWFHWISPDGLFGSFPMKLTCPLKKISFGKWVVPVGMASKTRSCCYYAEATLWSPTALKFFLPSPGTKECKFDKKGCYIPGPSKVCQLVPKGCQLTIPQGLTGTLWKVLMCNIVFQCHFNIQAFAQITTKETTTNLHGCFQK